MRTCPICKQPPREGQEMRPLRLAEGDRPGAEPGLYSACVECHQAMRPIIAQRLGKPAEELTHDDFA